MRCYIATRLGGTYTGGWYGCLAWAQGEVREDPLLVVKLHVARPRVKTVRVIAEVTANGVRLIGNGRNVPLAALRGRHG